MWECAGLPVFMQNVKKQQGQIHNKKSEHRQFLNLQILAHLGHLGTLGPLPPIWADFGTTLGPKYPTWAQISMERVPLSVLWTSSSGYPGHSGCFFQRSGFFFQRLPTFSGLGKQFGVLKRVEIHAELILIRAN